MRSVRTLAAAAAALLAVGLGGWLAPVAEAKSNPPVLETGWWSNRPGAQPMADEGFAIGWSLEQENSAAAVRIDLSGVLDGTVYLQLHEAGGTAPEQALARVCVTTASWKPANPGAYADLPASSCEPGQTIGLGRDAEALIWTADITSLVAAASGDTLALVVHPMGKPVTDGVATTFPFEVQFDTAAVVVDTAGGPPPDPEGVIAPPSFGTGGDSFVDPGLPAPDYGSGFEAPGLPSVGEPTTTVPSSVPTTLDAGSDDADAFGPVTPDSVDGRPWGRLLLLLPISTGIGFAMAAGRRWVLDRSQDAAIPAAS